MYLVAAHFVEGAFQPLGIRTLYRHEKVLVAQLGNCRTHLHISKRRLRRRLGSHACSVLHRRGGAVGVPALLGVYGGWTPALLCLCAGWKPALLCLCAGWR